MHVQLVTILDSKLEEVIRKFARMPFQLSAANFSIAAQILEHSSLMLKNYIDLLIALRLLPEKHEYYKQQIHITHTHSKIHLVSGDINEKILIAIKDRVTLMLHKYSEHELNPVISIYQHYNSPDELILVTGLSIIDKKASTAISLLHQLSLPVNLFEFNTYRPVYLIELLKSYQKDTNLSVHRLAAQYGKSYKQVQKDSKSYFGSTLYSFILKLKMLDTVEDIMFTDLSLKEIAYKNDFADYGSMYRLFKQYRFSLKQIPRFLEFSTSGIICYVLAAFYYM
ncbi:Helix-turn-helix domain-containing protein [Chryseobacterium wanjuense]|uniref:Helix-turn-helix domain-containing protein n=1 Tax=Chryseobacterium wanjuense TaxID=356305 RepID=A0A1I0QCQ4_9FLAO|nr:helix-turn-helix domain-containing protein [Chryseobacterium wanjuense]SEW24370.1 Helix-turn-helix domain-containing protein [Chryseobacterium wanjuense]